MMWDFKVLVRKQPSVAKLISPCILAKIDPFGWLKSACTEPGSKVMKRHQDKMSDSPTCKRQKPAKDEEVPNSLLSLPKDILQYCISFVKKGHYPYVGSVCKLINKIYANKDEDMNEIFCSNVTVSKDLVELCLQDYQKHGKRISDTKHG
jgi:hypothetical protein